MKMQNIWTCGIMGLAIGMSALNTLAGDALVTLDSTNGSSAFIVRDADSNELACVKSDGKVGIGTATPGNKLTVEGDGNSNTGVLGIDVTGSGSFKWASSALATNLAVGNNIIHMIGYKGDPVNAGYIGFNFQGNNSTNNYLTLGLFAKDNIMNILGNGRVGIGTAAPGYTLHVNGSVAGVGAYNALSDARLKKDVQPIGDALAIVEQLRGVTFNWDQSADPAINFDDRNHVGFLAQEVEVVLPQAVTTANDERQTKSVAYSEIIPVLAEAIKQQQAQIEALKAEIETLKAN